MSDPNEFNACLDMHNELRLRGLPLGGKAGELVYEYINGNLGQPVVAIAAGLVSIAVTMVSRLSPAARAAIAERMRLEADALVRQMQ
jgi:hypothetical protein